MKPLACYREEELEQMKCNFHEFDSGYHAARHNFVYQVNRRWTTPSRRVS